MINDISEIKTMRISKGMTQKNLSEISGVSQAMIARIEKGDVSPSFSNVKRIIDALNQYNKNDIKISNIMSKKIISIPSDKSIKNAASKMRKYSISQLPVINEKKLVGMISEKNIAHALAENSEKNIVENIMDSPPPVVDIKTSFEVIKGLLEYTPVIIVSKKGKYSGLITRADLLSLI